MFCKIIVIAILEGYLEKDGVKYYAYYYDYDRIYNGAIAKIVIDNRGVGITDAITDGVHRPINFDFYASSGPLRLRDCLAALRLQGVLLVDSSLSGLYQRESIRHAAFTRHSSPGTEKGVTVTWYVPFEQERCNESI